MELTHTHRPERVVAAVVAALVLVAVGLLATVDRDGDDAPGIRFVPRAAVATPGDGLDWWTPVHGEPLGVAVDGADVVAAALDEVRLLDGRDGNPRWTAPVPGVRRYRPALAGDRVAATGETELVLLERVDGTRVASVPFAGPGPASLLGGPDGRPLAAAGSESGQLLVVDALDGTVRWSVTHPGEIAVAPRGDRTTLVAAWHEPAGSTLRAFDAASGGLRWERPLGPVAGAPALADDTVVVAHGDGIHSSVVRALDLATGTDRWQVPLAGWWDEALEAAVAPDAVYLLDGMGTVVAVELATGAVRWRQETGRPLVDGRLVLAADAVVFASYDDELMVLDRADGRIRAAEPQRGVPVDLAATPEGLVVALRLGEPSRVEARPVP